MVQPINLHLEDWQILFKSLLIGFGLTFGACMAWTTGQIIEKLAALTVKLVFHA